MSAHPYEGPRPTGRARPRLVIRYAAGTRLNHWLVAILFFCAALTGLALFHPYFFPLVNLFGGGQWSRILHPFFGVAMFVLFAWLAIRLARHNLWRSYDRDWLRGAGSMMAGRPERTLPVGRYNAGQKILFWLMVLSLLILLITGVMFWRPYFAHEFPIGVIRFAALLHAISAAVLVLGVIVHIYAAIWVKGTMRAMTRGTVTETWARHHHPLWHSELTDKDRV